MTLDEAVAYVRGGKGLAYGAKMLYQNGREVGATIWVLTPDEDEPSGVYVEYMSGSYGSIRGEADGSPLEAADIPTGMEFAPTGLNEMDVAALGWDDPQDALRKLRGTPLIGKVGRNAPCPCGSGKKFKQCHGRSGG